MIEFLVASWTALIIVASFCLLGLFWFFVYAGSVTGVGGKSYKNPGIAFYISVILWFALSIFPTFIIDMKIGCYLMDLVIIFGGLFVTTFLVVKYSRKK